MSYPKKTVVVTPKIAGLLGIAQSPNLTQHAVKVSDLHDVPCSEIRILYSEGFVQVWKNGCAYLYVNDKTRALAVKQLELNHLARSTVDIN